MGRPVASKIQRNKIRGKNKRQEKHGLIGWELGVRSQELGVNSFQLFDLFTFLPFPKKGIAIASLKFNICKMGVASLPFVVSPCLLPLGTK